MLTQFCAGYLKTLKSVHHQPQCNIDKCNRVARFLDCCSWNSSAGNVPQVLQSVFWGTQCSLYHPTGKSLVVLSQETGLDTPHFLFVLSIFWGFHFSGQKNVMNTGFKNPVSWQHCLADFLRNFVKACETVSTFPLLTELWGSSERPSLTFCTVPSTTNLLCNRAIVAHASGGVPLHLSISPPHSHSLFSSSI